MTPLYECLCCFPSRSACAGGAGRARVAAWVVCAPGEDELWVRRPWHSR
jgi:hypothetical protein